MPNNSVMTSVYAFPYTLWGLGVKSLSRVGKGVSDMTLRFVYGAKLTIFGTTNGVARIKIYIGDKIFGNKFLRICFSLWWPFLVALQEQPSLSRCQNFDRWIYAWKLMQHLEICLPTTEAFFPFQLSFTIILFLKCRHKIKYHCCQVSFSVFPNWIVSLVFRRGKCRTADGYVCDSSCRLLRRIIRIFSSTMIELDL